MLSAEPVLWGGCCLSDQPDWNTCCLDATLESNVSSSEFESWLELRWGSYREALPSYSPSSSLPAPVRGRSRDCLAAGLSLAVNKQELRYLLQTC